MGRKLGKELRERSDIVAELANLVRNTDDTQPTATRLVTLLDRESKSRGVINGGFIAAGGHVVLPVGPIKGHRL